jgi:hypothetical protein
MSEANKTSATGDIEVSSDKRALFWVCAILATLLYLFFGFMMLMVPGILPREKLLMLAIVAIGTAISLSVGVWKLSTTDAPVADSRPASVMGVILLLELAHCVVGIIAVASKQMR